jgi:SAM-dependent methyltransferase
VVASTDGRGVFGWLLPVQCQQIQYVMICQNAGSLQGTTRGLGRKQDSPMRPDSHSVIISSVPDGCERVLDVGCGPGGLTRRLRALVPTVMGIDRISEASSTPALIPTQATITRPAARSHAGRSLGPADRRPGRRSATQGPSGRPGGADPQLARDLIADIRAIDARVIDNTKRMAEVVKTTDSTLTTVDGVGPMLARQIPGPHRRPSRFPADPSSPPTPAPHP